MQAPVTPGPAPHEIPAAVGATVHPAKQAVSEPGPPVGGVSVDEALCLGAVCAGEGGGRDGLQSLLGATPKRVLQPAEGNLPPTGSLPFGEVPWAQLRVDIVVLPTRGGNLAPPRVIVVDDDGDTPLGEHPPLREGWPREKLLQVDPQIQLSELLELLPMGGGEGGEERRHENVFDGHDDTLEVWYALLASIVLESKGVPFHCHTLSTDTSEE